MSRPVGPLFLDRSRCYLTDRLLPKLERCLDELSEEEIWWRSHENANSVGNLVLHLCGNLQQWILSSLGGRPDTRDRDSEFTRRGPLAREELLALVRSTVRDCAHVLEAVEEESLTRTYAIQQGRFTGLEAVLHAVEHFSHHVGQIIYITKLKRGIDLKLTNTGQSRER